MSQKKIVKILSIDGGGVRGLIPAMLLKALSNEMNHPNLHECFDLVAGTSTGALIALLLTAPSTHHTSHACRTYEIVDLYEHDAHLIFNPSFRNYRVFSQIFKPKYSSTNLSKLCTQYFASSKLHESLTNLLIPAFDTRTMTPYFFKHRPLYKRSMQDLDFYLKDIALAATAAPTYLPPAQITSTDGLQSYCFVDGGLFANNPALCAYIEAKKIYPEAEKFLIISLGTGTNTRSYTCKNAKGWGVFGWMNPFKHVPLLSSFMYAQQGSVIHMLNKEPDTQLIRLNPTLTGLSSEIDDASTDNIQQLKERSLKYIAENDHVLRRIAKLLKS